MRKRRAIQALKAYRSARESILSVAGDSDFEGKHPGRLKISKQVLEFACICPERLYPLTGRVLIRLKSMNVKIRLRCGEQTHPLMSLQDCVAHSD